MTQRATISEVAESLYVARSWAGGRRNDVYVWAGSERVVIADSGYAGTARQTIAPLLAKLNVGDLPITCIVSHGDVDHYGGAAELASLFPHLAIGCHRDDKPWVTSVERVIAERYREFAREGLDREPETLDEMRRAAQDAPVTATLRGGETLDLGHGRTISIHHTPGHTPGSLVLFDSAVGSLVSGDAVLGNGVADRYGRPILPPTYRDVGGYVESIGRVRALGPISVHTSHLGSFADSAAMTLLDRSLEHVQQVDTQLLNILAGCQRPSLRDLVDMFAHRLGAPWDAPAAAIAMPLAAHLNRLTTRGVVRVVGGAGARRYRLEA